MARQYHKGEQPPQVLKSYGSDRFSKYFYLRVGEVLEVDLKLYRVRIKWLQGSEGSPTWIPISFAYCGPAGCLGAMPEPHALVICAYYNEGMGHGAPLILAYLPAALNVGLEYNHLKFNPDQLSNEDENLIPYKFRDLGSGDVIMSSSLGGMILTNTGVEISDSMQDNILMRSADQSLIMTSLNNFVFADGVSVSAGPVVRNLASIFDEKGNRLPNVNTRELTLPDGRQIIYVVPFGDRIEYDTPYFSEYRIDVDEVCDGILDVNEINEGASVTNRDPIVTMAMGNYVMADRSRKQYGTIVRPNLFTAYNDTEGFFDLTQCVQNSGLDETSKLGLAYALHFLKSGTFIGVDKEGHYYMNLTSSMAHPLGSGRSMSILAQGNLKEIWGFAAKDGNSWDLTAKGGIRWAVGVHNGLEKSRSISIRTDGAIYTEIGGTDDDGFAKNENILGDSIESIAGVKTENISGDSNIEIGGGLSEHVMGSGSYLYDVDKTENIFGVSTELVVKEKQSRIGKRKTTITAGNDELTVIGGNIEETIQFFGNRKTTIMVTGNIEEDITTGNRKTSIKLGNYEVNVTAGNIDIKTSAGVVTISGTTVDVKGTATINVTAPTVNIGQGPRGGVVTGTPGVPSHFDYITGAALKGALTVKAGA